MGQFTLGLDLGTNSIGWAVVESDKGEFKLKEKGVRIFQEGVKIEKGVESSKAAERTDYRSARRLKFRRKLRKIETLKVLSEHGFCPRLTEEELNLWRYGDKKKGLPKTYPQNKEFRNWWLTDNQGSKSDREQQRKNPYYFRHLAVTLKLDLSEFDNRKKIGRAFYHIAQRRGFLSNRLEGESDGVVTGGINEITQAKGERTLGQYFYEDFYLKGKRIRNHYTHREEHYLEEFNRICEFQNISAEIQKKLCKAIFYQRPLKSQKGLIGKCVFEKNKPRCAVSRPEFEEYRMLCFVNNIKIKTPNDDKLRPLNKEERSKVVPRFFLHREHFDFEDIAKALAPKKRYSYYKDRTKKKDDYLFNFSMKTTVSGCPVSARFKELFGTEFISDSFELVLNESGQIPKKFSDAWHAALTFDSTSKLQQFAIAKLGLAEESAEKLSKIRLKQDYASLSLKAIKNILPFLREGLIYSHAVFLGNIKSIFKDYSTEELEDVLDNVKVELKRIFRIINNKNDAINVANGFIRKIKNRELSERDIDFNEINSAFESLLGPNRWNRIDEFVREQIISDVDGLLADSKSTRWEFHQLVKKQDMIWQFLKSKYGVVKKQDELYHPSAIDTYKPAKQGTDGKCYLGSPMVSAVRNPMAMRALHQLRKVINELIRKDIITRDTSINIEMSRGLLNANERTGVKRWQDDREKKRKEYAQYIQEYFDESGISASPSAEEILKYQLWIEQGEHCLYTGKQIGLSDFLGSNPKFDIEHTIPRSLSFDNSQANKTLCCAKFNRDVKKNRIPYELTNHEEILQRIEPWQNKIDDITTQVNLYKAKSTKETDKKKKDGFIQKFHENKYKRQYWIDKCRRFTMDHVPEGFKNSQKVDIGIITKYSRLYLQTLFDKVYTVKGSIVADFRKIWGLQDNYTKKERVNHVHHCIDAITMACISKQNYENLAKFYHDWEELYQAKVDSKPKVRKPWETFVEDIKKVEEEILVSHYTPDNLPRKAKKKLRKRGEIIYSIKDFLPKEFENKKEGKDYYKIVLKDGAVKYKVPRHQAGDSVRGSLHKDTFYGAIERKVTNKKGEEEKVIKYVVRKPLDGLETSALKNIVDERVREIVTLAREQEKALKKEIDNLLKQRKKVDGLEEKLIDEKIAALKEKISNLYCMPNKNGSPIPIKKVRLYQPTVTNPLHIKTQRDQKQNGKRKAYKESYHVANDGNYLMAIYEGVDKKGKIKRSFELVNNLKAGKFYNEKLNEQLIPETKNSLTLKGTLKTGTLVLFYENTPDEIFNLSPKTIRQRLYKVVKMSKNGQVTFKFHQVAANDEILKENYEVITGEKAPKSLTNGESKFNFSIPVPKLLLTPGNFNFLIDGQDFKLTVLGEIERL